MRHENAQLSRRHNLRAYYATWYHKFNDNWHTATEYWYQWENKVPNVNSSDPAAAALLQTGANGAFCKNTLDLTCYAPDMAVVNYVNRQLSKNDFISIRNEFFNDQVGQWTGTRSRYSEHGLSWNHRIGTTVLLRPELRAATRPRVTASPVPVPDTCRCASPPR